MRKDVEMRKVILDIATMNLGPNPYFDKRYGRWPETVMSQQYFRVTPGMRKGPLVSLIPETIIGVNDVSVVSVFDEEPGVGAGYRGRGEHARTSRTIQRRRIWGLAEVVGLWVPHLNDEGDAIWKIMAVVALLAGRISGGTRFIVSFLSRNFMQQKVLA